MLVMEMSNKKQQIPAIRFNGFTDAWEQRKFSDLIQTMRGGASIAPDDYKDKGIATVPKGAINSTGIADLSGSKYVSKEFFEKNKNSSVYSDELVTSLRDLVPSAPNMGRIVKLKGKDHRYLMPQGVYNLVLQDEVDENFLISFTNTSKFRKIISQEKNGSTQVHIRNSEYLGISIITPDSEEQNKIGSFFKQLDATIALHQDAIQHQQNLKKAMLQKLFPVNGDSIPTVRFANFKEEWEQRKLDDVSEKVTEKNKNRKVTETLTNSAEYGIISQSDFFDKDISNINNIDGYYVVRPDDFVYNPRISNYAPVGPIKRNNLNKIGVMSPLYYVFRIKDIDPSFLEKYFDTAYWHMFMKLNGDSGARADRFAIKDSVFKQMPIPYPSIEEQVKLGNFFKQLDDTIALHQQKINDYLQLKNAMLQQLFV